MPAAPWPTGSRRNVSREEPATKNKVFDGGTRGILTRREDGIRQHLQMLHAWQIRFDICCQPVQATTQRGKGAHLSSNPLGVSQPISKPARSDMAPSRVEPARLALRSGVLSRTFSSPNGTESLSRQKYSVSKNTACLCRGLSWNSVPEQAWPAVPRPAEPRATEFRTDLSCDVLTSSYPLWCGLFCLFLPSRMGTFRGASL